MTSSREGSHQGPPPDDLTDFPTIRVRKRSRWYRCHQVVHGPWWFASHPPDSAGGGRWDLPEPDGTLHAAESSEAALLEVAGPELHDFGFVVGSWLDRRAISAVPMPAGFMAADLTSPDVSSFGVTSELTGALPYRRTRPWAIAFRAAGLGGIRSLLRFAPNRGGVAVFGPAGAPAEAPSVVSVRSARSVASDADLRVVEPPGSRDLLFADPG